MKRVLFMAPFFVITAALSQAGCKKAGPVVPYDLRIPPLNADLAICALDLGQPVTTLGIELYSPSGKKYIGFTDLFGRVGWDFDDMERGTWNAKVPTQKNRYYDSQIDFKASDGQVAVTFKSDPALVLEPTTNTTYSYTTQTDMAVSIQYNQGGALNVPVTMAISNMPAGWTYNYTPIMGIDSHNGVVSISVPTGQYRQPILDMFGLIAGPTPGIPATYIYTNTSPISSVTIKRNFSIQVNLAVVWSTTIAGSPPNQIYIISGQACLQTTNAGAVPWSGSLSVGNSLDAVHWGSYAVSGSGTPVCTAWNGSCAVSDGHSAVGVMVTINVSAPDVGTYSYQIDTGLPPNSTNSYTLPTNTY